MNEHDLRRKAQRLTDLRRRHDAHDTLSDDELAELNRGIPADEMREIIAAIRQERRSAAPSKKTKVVEKERSKSKPIDVFQFMDEEHKL